MASNKRTYSNFKYIPTWKLKEILDDPYCRGTDGHNYEPYREELEEVYWERVNKENDKLIKEMCNEQRENPEIFAE